MTKTAAMSVYGKKTLLPFSSLEPVEQFQRNLVCRIRDYGLSLFVEIITLGWYWPIFRQSQILQLRFLYRKCDNDGFF